MTYTRGKNPNSRNGFQKGHKGIVGAKNTEWKGDKAGYTALHDWVRKWKGNAKRCERCGLNDPKRMYHWANVDHSYKRILEDYISMCVSCHRKYDMENNNVSYLKNDLRN